MSAKDLFLLVLSFALGSVPFAYLLTRWNLGRDIREMGSGNVGATNVLRTQGKLLGALTLLLDFAKAAAAVWFCRRWGDAPWLDTAGGAAAVLGHCFPPALGFRGGKGIASGLGAFLFIAPVPTLIALGAFVLEVLILRFVSLGSILGSLTFGASMLVLHAAKGWYSLPQVAIAGGLCLLLVQRHHKNIARILRGEEPRIWGKKRAPSPAEDRA
jgi:glycerol-3-phosphate acyltransferase PlsY